MKLRFQSIPTIVLALLTLLAFSRQLATAQAQGTAFTYQGKLNSSGTATTGSYDFRFRLASDNLGNTYVGSPFLTNGVAVTNGLFTTLVDFGAGIFTGSNYWLEVDVRTNGVGGYTALFPLQAVTPTPYATFAGTAGAANTINGTIANASLPSSPSFSGTVTAVSLAGNGGNVTNVNAAALNGLTATNFWQLGGNTVSAGQFIGSANNQPVEIRVNGLRALQITPPAIATDSVLSLLLSNMVNVVEGYGYMAPGIGGSIILGGGFEYNSQFFTNSIFASLSFIGNGYANSIATNSFASFIGAGANNHIGTNAYESFIGGGFDNNIGSNSYSAFIGGGGQNSIEANSRDAFIGAGDNNDINYAIEAFIGGGSYNFIRMNAGGSVIVGGANGEIGTNAADSFIGGGQGNTIAQDSYQAFIGGGQGNNIQTNSWQAAIVAGSQNTIGSTSGYSFIGSGYQNNIQGDGLGNFIGGGEENNIQPSTRDAVIGGGSGNIVSATFGTVPGGAGNVAGGTFSFAAGNNAHATNNGAFVWSDGTGTLTASAVSNSVTMRASGGYRFFTSTGTAGAQLLANATAWTTISDRNAKKNFQAVDTLAVLDKLAAIPVQEWNYKWEKDSDVPNIGPMAQDFKHAFYPGRDDKGISTLEFDGVELAAIQGLNQKLNEKDAEIEALKAKTDKMDSLEKQLAELELQVKSLAEKK